MEDNGDNTVTITIDGELAGVLPMSLDDACADVINNHRASVDDYAEKTVWIPE